MQSSQEAVLVSGRSERRLRRRQWLGLSGFGLLALGFWPGCVRALGRRERSFNFVVLNDTHFQCAKCGPWFDKVRASIRMQKPRPEFCLVVGDLSEHGTAGELRAMREVLRSFGLEYHVVIGNHDYLSDTDRSTWDAVFPQNINYSLRRQGWQFVGLDSTEGTKWENTRIPSETLKWAEANVRNLDPRLPTVLFTHFPLGEQVRMRPANANVLLDCFRHLNLVAVFNGHFHGLTERRSGPTVLTTNRCCAISRGNHDGSSEKGYFLCTAREGSIRRQFVEVQG